MKKSDSQIHRDVLDELEWDPRVEQAEIAVAVQDGVVTLSGKVDSYAQKYAGEHAAQRVSGVRALADGLHVKILGDLQRNETEIAHAAVNALKWDVEVPTDRVTVRVENGYMVLEGKVDWQFQKSAAERATRYLSGVKGVTNMIVVRPKPSTVEVKSKIENALKRSAELDARRIIVDAIDGKVILKGNVRSWAERQHAERAAWSAPGVSQVDDRLVVSA